MASIIAKLPPPTILIRERQALYRTLQNVTCIPATRGVRLSRHLVAAKATADESSTSLSIVDSVQNAWNKPEDRIAVIGLGFAAIVGLWASINLVSAIDSLPVIPGVFELIGILFSSWFVYRYLLFKPDREELSGAIEKSISGILGQ